MEIIKASNEEIDRLRAEVEALRAGIEKAMSEIDDAGPKALKYARQELEAAIAQPSTPWVNPLAAEVEKLRECLRNVANIAHAGGLAKLDVPAAMCELRRLTLRHWNESGTLADMVSRVQSSIDAARAEGGKGVEG